VNLKMAKSGEKWLSPGVHWGYARPLVPPVSWQAHNHTVSGSLRHEVILFRGREGQEGLTQSGEFHTLAPLFISSNSRLAVLAGILGGMKLQTTLT
jgi:hypothetical protein